MSYGCGLAPAAAAQGLAAMKVMMGPEGKQRVLQLANNNRYFRERLKQMGLIVYGNDDSPIVPMMVYLVSQLT